jgi:hypothetical protein
MGGAADRMALSRRKFLALFGGSEGGDSAA